MENYAYDICILGDIGTGKTAFVKRLISNVFSTHYSRTEGFDAFEKFEKIDDLTYRLKLLDIGGQERFGNMMRLYYIGIMGAFVVVDSTRSSTFDGAIAWKRNFEVTCNWQQYYPEGASCPVILLINKDDLHDDIINYHGFCKEYGFHSWIVTSMKDNVGIKDALHSMIKICKNTTFPKIERLPKTIQNPVEVSTEKVSSLPTIEKLPTIVEISTEKVSSIPSTNSEDTSRLITREFLSTVLAMIREKQSDNRTHGEYIMSMKLLFIDIYLGQSPKIKSFHEQIKIDEKFRDIATDVYDILMDDSLCDSIKVNNILNWLMTTCNSSCLS
jgi:small GTP-binding protein